MSTYPDSLRKDGPFWFLRHVYRNITVKDKHFASVCCGESGSGKSTVTMAIANALYNKFVPEESFAFSPAQFATFASQSHPKLYPIILDDAGLSAFSGDALTAQVKMISKIAQSIRYKNWQIHLNLPSVELLAKSVRLTNHYYIEPKHIDYKNQITYIKFQRLVKTKKELIFKNMRLKRKKFNPVTGYTHVYYDKLMALPIPKPNDELIDRYKKLKEEFMEKYRQQTAEAIYESALSKGAGKNRLFEIADTLRPNLDKYTNDKGKMDIAKIMLDFRVSKENARIVYKMASAPPSEQDIKKGKRKLDELAESMKNKDKDLENKGLTDEELRTIELLKTLS